MWKQGFPMEEKEGPTCKKKTIPKSSIALYKRGGHVPCSCHGFFFYNSTQNVEGYCLSIRSIEVLMMLKLDNW
jgi:hypothetical protein